LYLLSEKEARLKRLTYEYDEKDERLGKTV